jgi:hypothetical protein
MPDIPLQDPPTGPACLILSLKERYVRVPILQG